MEYTSPEETIEAFLSSKSSAELRQLASISDISEERTKYIVRGLRDEGKVRFHGDDQQEGAPVAEWIGS